MINGRTQKLERKMERNTFNCRKPLSNFCSKIMLLILLVPIFNMFCGSDDLRLKFIRVKEKLETTFSEEEPVIIDNSEGDTEVQKKINRKIIVEEIQTLDYSQIKRVCKETKISVEKFLNKLNITENGIASESGRGFKIEQTWEDTLTVNVKPYHKTIVTIKWKYEWEIGHLEVVVDKGNVDNNEYQKSFAFGSYKIPRKVSLDCKINSEKNIKYSIFPYSGAIILLILIPLLIFILKKRSKRRNSYGAQIN